MKNEICDGKMPVLCFLTALFLFSPIRVHAVQKNAEESRPASAAEDRNAGSADPHSYDPAVLAARIDELARKVEELGRTIEILTGHVPPVNSGKDIETQKMAQMGTAASLPSPEDSENSRQSEKRAGQPTGNPAVMAASLTQEGPAPAEHTAKMLGPLRFGGDFRLRLDGIFRPAFNAADPDQKSFPHVQNVRGRYRLRLNLDADIHPMVSFHGQLATGPLNNPLTLDQDFAGIAARPPYQVNEAWVDFHPAKWATFQGGRLQEVFADNLRFLFDDDIAFNGFNQRFTHDFSSPVAGLRRIEFRSGQYIFTNPNVAIVTPDNLAPAGAIIGSTGRAAQMFHQGFLAEHGLSSKASQVLGADIQLYRNPNQIQFASTSAGVPILVQNTFGTTLSGPLSGTGNATTLPGGAVYTARNFQVARLAYRFDYTGLKSANREYPITVNLQAARNIGTGAHERDALLANITIGQVKSRWDRSFLYLFAIKGANSMISQLTDDDLGTCSGVNIRAHYFRFDLGLAKGIQLQNLFFIQNELRNSGQFPGFFVPLESYAPRQYRFQEQILFVF